jgi:hypothetical protein
MIDCSVTILWNECMMVKIEKNAGSMILDYWIKQNVRVPMAFVDHQGT